MSKPETLMPSAILLTIEMKHLQTLHILLDRTIIIRCTPGITGSIEKYIALTRYEACRSGVSRKHIVIFTQDNKIFLEI